MDVTDQLRISPLIFRVQYVLRQYAAGAAFSWDFELSQIEDLSLAHRWPTRYRQGDFCFARRFAVGRLDASEELVDQPIELLDQETVVFHLLLKFAHAL
jgi:hypothetical protein